MAVDEKEQSLTGQIEQEKADVQELLEKMELDLQMTGEYDSRPAILSVKSGAGGVDAQDWADMLVRMYARWAESRGFKWELMHRAPGEEAGIRSSTIRVEGSNAYGYLQTERGVHRLIRLSPFDSDHRRHTSFALIEVLPEPEDEEEVKINPDDLHYDFFRASGHGGQSVQKNSTAVRVKHIPTGIVVSVQNERSQLQNRQTALHILQARLLDLEMQKRREKQRRLKGEHIAAEFGNQARSYFIHPYQMVKDHRTNFQMTDAVKVLDGNINGFLEASLVREAQAAQQQE